MLRTIDLLLLLLSLSGALGQIPPSAFQITGSNPSPPPPPPPPSGISVAFDGVSPPPPATPAPAPTTSPSTGTVSPATQSSKGSSGISGGAIAGIVIGVVAGLAILALLALFLFQRKRRSHAQSNDLEANQLNKNNPSEAVSTKNSNMHDHLGSLNHKASGLDWKDGDEIKSVSLNPAAAATTTTRTATQRTIIEESLSDVQRSGTEPQAPSTPDLTSSAVQVMPDSTKVVIHKGPGGSIHIQRIASDGTLSTGAPNSQASTISANSGGTMGSKGSSSVDLPDLPWSDWQLKADDIIFAIDEEGQPVKLGSGAYGTVYKATIDGVTECACKVFHDVHNQLQQADILREVAILKSCRDRNIVQFLGACVMDERIMLVTELMEAGDLWNAIQQYKDSGALSWYRRGKRIAVEVARGLHFLHRHKIIHFDLKSPNVLLSRDGQAKISDVGFANILSNTHLSNNTTAFTFAWAAPEILMGKGATEKVDIFSYGVTLWEIVTGLHPQRGQLRDCVVPDECPAEVERLIQQCLSYEPMERPTCKEIVEILNSVEHLQAPTSPSVTNSSAPLRD